MLSDDNGELLHYVIAKVAYWFRLGSNMLRGAQSDLFRSNEEIVDMNRRSRDVEDRGHSVRILGIVEGAKVSRVIGSTAVIPEICELDISVGHRLEVGDVLLNSELVFEVEIISDLSHVYSDVGPFLVPNEIVCRGYMRE